MGGEGAAEGPDGLHSGPRRSFRVNLHRTLLAQDRRDDAAALFLAESVGVPAEAVEGMRASEMWAWFTGLAHTLPYDVAVCGPGNVLPSDRLAAIDVPTLALTGSNSPEWLQAATRAVANAIPGAQFASIEGQDHSVLQHPDALRDILTNFFLLCLPPDSLNLHSG